MRVGVYLSQDGQLALLKSKFCYDLMDIHFIKGDYEVTVFHREVKIILGTWEYLGKL